MNRIEEKMNQLKAQGKKAFITYTTAGLPDMDTTGNEVLEPGESCTITFTVKWKKDSTAKSASAEFDIELDYEQSTEEFKGSASHNSVHTK